MLDWQQIDTVLLDMDGTLLDLHFDNYFWFEYLPVEYAKHHNKEPEEVRSYLIQLMKEAEGKIDWYCVDFWTEKLGMEKGQISKIENGKFNLTLATINKIAAALGARINFDLQAI